MQQHNASLQGGSEKSNFYGSLGYHGQNGLYQHGNDKYERYNLTFNYSQDVAEWLELGFSTKYIHTKNDDPNLENAGMANPQYETYRTFPTVVMYLPDGSYAGMEGRRFNKNISARMATAGRNKREVDDVWFTGKFKMTPTEGLSVQGDYTVNKWFRYDFASKYLLEVNGRYDGSSKYREGNRWGFFPSASLGWRISEEDFFSPWKSAVDNLKLRFSLGELENQVTTGNFDYVASVNGYLVNYLINSRQLVGIAIASKPQYYLGACNELQCRSRLELVEE